MYSGSNRQKKNRKIQLHIDDEEENSDVVDWNLQQPNLNHNYDDDVDDDDEDEDEEEGDFDDEDLIFDQQEDSLSQKDAFAEQRELQAQIESRPRRIFTEESFDQISSYSQQKNEDGDEFDEIPEVEV